MAGEFDKLQSLLKQEFPDYHFPKMPGKWLFHLSDQQLDARRRGLEQFLEKVCATRVLAECDILQEFLATTQNHTSHQRNNNNSVKSKVELKVQLSDHSVISVKIFREATAAEVCQVLLNKLQVGHEAMPYFALFEAEEYCFDRKLQSDECPHALYIDNFNSASSTCILLKKWIFSPEKERLLCHDEQALSLIYSQSLEEVGLGQVQVGDKLKDLKLLSDAGRKEEYLELVRPMDGHCTVSFPHCECDSRKNGHVIAIVGYESFKLQACKEDGTKETQVIEFQWKDIQQYELDTDKPSFNFEYYREGRKPRLVKIFTHYGVYMYECFDRVRSEILSDKSKQNNKR